LRSEQDLLDGFALTGRALLLRNVLERAGKIPPMRGAGLIGAVDRARAGKTFLEQVCRIKPDSRLARFA